MGGNPTLTAQVGTDRHGEGKGVAGSRMAQLGTGTRPTAGTTRCRGARSAWHCLMKTAVEFGESKTRSQLSWHWPASSLGKDGDRRHLPPPQMSASSPRFVRSTYSTANAGSQVTRSAKGIVTRPNGYSTISADTAARCQLPSSKRGTSKPGWRAMQVGSLRPPIARPSR